MEDEPINDAQDLDTVTPCRGCRHLLEPEDSEAMCLATDAGRQIDYLEGVVHRLHYVVSFERAVDSAAPAVPRRNMTHRY